MNRCLFIAIAMVVLPAAAVAGPQDAVMAALTAAATSADPAFKGFSADSGKALFMATRGGGKPDTPSCTTCHTANPAAGGKTRAGKAIEPMAVSANPQRFTDLDKVEKWFGRNCNSVLGRECTAHEKGGVAAWLIAQ